MSKTIIIHEDRIEVLREGYNLIEYTVYDPEILIASKALATELEGEK